MTCMLEIKPLNFSLLIAKCDTLGSKKKKNILSFTSIQVYPTMTTFASEKPGYVMVYLF